MGVPDLPDLLVHPRCNASCDGFALEQVLRLARPDEFKRADVPTVTRSMHIAIQDLKLDTRYVVYPGDQRDTLMEGVQAVPLWALLPAR